MTLPGGYMGRFLNVDLTQGDLGEEQPDEGLLRAFVGGYGLGARILYERQPGGADPLGPDNMLGLVTGPLTGTSALMSSRYCAVARSPLTGGWGDANSGGQFGPALKFAGYDALFVRGIAPRPVYLLIEESHAQLLPAGDLWGLDCIETESTLQARHGKDVRVACVGPAGERLALISCIINDRGRAAGRSGLGAVMGSKRLKAVAVSGSQRPTVTHPGQVKALRSKYLAQLKDAPDAKFMREFGTAGYTKALIEMGRTPVRNWGGTFPNDLENTDALDGPAVLAFQERRYACWHCTQGCGGIMRWESGGQVYEAHKPEYETLGLLGSSCRIDDLQAVMDMNDLCNRAGLDTISAGAVIAFAMECYEHGLLTPQELDGLKLEWGDGQAAKALLQRIAERRGLGDLLADGVRRASQAMGRGSEAYAMHAGGQELPAHDPRQYSDFALAYQMSPTPGRHTQGGVGGADQPPERKAALGLDPNLEAEDPLRFHAVAYAALMAVTNVVNAAGLCTFGADGMGPDHVPAFMSAVTGWDFDMAECQRAGERIEVMRHLFSLREGHNPLKVQLPPRVLGQPPFESGPTAGVTLDMAALRSAYLEVLDWDPVSARPSSRRLAELGLDNLEVPG